MSALEHTRTRHLAFAVDDIDAVVSRLRSRGGQTRIKLAEDGMPAGA